MFTINRKKSTTAQYELRLNLIEQYVKNHPKPSSPRIKKFLEEKVKEGYDITVPSERQICNILNKDFTLVDGFYRRTSVLDESFDAILTLLPSSMNDCTIIGDQKYSIFDLVDYTMSSSKIQKRKERVFREIINAYNNDNQERQWYIIFSFPSTGTEFTIAKYLHAYFDISTLCIIPGIGGIIIYFNNSEDLKNLLPKLINLFG